MASNCFTPNHRKLLYDCYPKGKALAEAGTTGYSPISNDVSKLSYYCSTRKQKLVKIGSVLVDHVRSDVSSASTNPKSKSRLCISLAITLRLVDDCRQSLGIFAANVLDIVQISLQVTDSTRKTPDLDVFERAAAVFVAFATYATVSLVGSDARLITLYLRCLQCLGHVSQQKYENAAASANLHLITLKTLNGCALSELLTLKELSQQFNTIAAASLIRCQPGMVSVVQLTDMASQDDTDLRASTSSFSARPALADRRPKSVRRMPDVEKEKAGGTETITLQAVHTLRSLCRVAPISQQKSIIEALVKWLVANPKALANSEWTQWLFTSCLEWTPLLFRHAAISAIFEAIAQSKSTELQSSLLDVLSSIFSSTTALTGLAVGEMLQKLLSILTLACSADNTAAVDSTTKCINSFNSRSYYDGQASDTIRDLLANALALASAQTQDEASRKAHTTAILCHLRAVMEILSAHHKTTAKGALSIDSWQESLFLFAYSEPLVKLTYSHALLAYIDILLQTQPASVINPGSTNGPIGRFSDALAAAAFSIIQGYPIKRRRNSLNTQTSSRSSTNPASPEAAHAPLTSTSIASSDLDRAAMHDILVKITTASSLEPILAIVPMLFSVLNSNAAEASKSCATEIAEAIAQANVYHQASTKQLPPLQTSLGASDLKDWSKPTSSAASSSSIHTLLAQLSNSTELQDRGGLDEAGLRERLSAQWSIDSALNHAVHRVVSKSGRLALPRSSPVKSLHHDIHSQQNPSVQDLRASLALQPSRNSLILPNGDASSPMRRRASQAPSPDQLALLGIHPTDSPKRHSLHPTAP